MTHAMLQFPLHSQHRVLSSISLIKNSPVPFPYLVLSFLKITYCCKQNCIGKYTNIYTTCIPWILGSSAWLIYQMQAVHLNLNNFWLQTSKMSKKKKKKVPKKVPKCEGKLYRAKQEKNCRILHIEMKHYWKKIRFKRQYLLDIYIYNYHLHQETYILNVLAHHVRFPCLYNVLGHLW